jgi:hypothetical protein
MLCHALNRVLFPSRSPLVEEVLLAMVKNPWTTCFGKSCLCNVIFASFDLWMFHNGVDIFYLIINFLNETRVPMHVNVGLFEVNETIQQYMVVQLQVLLDRFGLLHRVIAFVKD